MTKLREGDEVSDEPEEEEEANKKSRGKKKASGKKTKNNKVIDIYNKKKVIDIFIACVLIL